MLEKLLKYSKVIDIYRNEDNDIWIMFCADDTDIPHYCLRIQCPFRILYNKRVMIGATDMDDLLENDEEYETRFDAVVGYKVLPVLPQKITASNFNEIGDIRIYLENGMILETFIQACTNDDIEDWKFIDCINDEQYYFVNHLLKKQKIRKTLTTVICMYGIWCIGNVFINKQISEAV
jgi:hypothetical protein